MPEERTRSDAPRPDDLSFAERPEVAGRLLDYFRRNPTAMDSVDGIARFWVHEDRAAVERALVQLEGGGLLEKRVIAGTDFYALPREPLPASPDAREGLAIRPAFRTAAPGRILVVEDDDLVRGLLLDILGGAGHQVASASSGGAALDLLKAHGFDLVITDVVMPAMSGLEVLEAVKRHGAPPEVIMITGHPDLSVAVTALRRGAYDLITKPIVDLEAFHRVVERALERQRLSTESRMLVATLQARNRESAEMVARLSTVNEIGRATTGLLSLKEICDVLTRQVAQHFRARRVSVLITEPGSDTMSMVSAVGIAEPEARERRVRVGEGIAGKVALTDAPLLVPDIEKSDLRLLKAGGRYSTPSFMITPLAVTYPIHFQRKRLGVLNVSDRESGGPFNAQDLEFLSTIASQVAVAMEIARLVEEVNRGYLGALARVIQGAEEARPESRGHTQAVLELTTKVGQALRLAPERLEVLKQAAALHEIGRILAPLPETEAKDRLRAPISARWDAEAALAAERVLASIASLQPAREVILHSAVRAEGTAPGLEKAGISLEAGILAACEEYIEMSRGGGDQARREAMHALQSGAGTRHDPDVVAALACVVEVAAG
jgi:response regulator RpfG family c-di-GMP phosphodiesterase